jgi:ribosomal protein S18 acetylase RimI-like enzyme
VSDEILRMRVELTPPVLQRPTWPAAVSVRTFDQEDAEPLHALFEHGYRRGGGSVTPFETWLRETTSDPEFDGSLVFLAEADEGLVGAALCWTSAFVKDIVVHEAWRRRGLGEALLRHVLGAFAERGALAVQLKVESTNDGARRLYERVGFRVVERLPLG